jgi:hypothetical protein
MTLILQTTRECNRQRILDMIRVPMQHIMRYRLHLESRCWLGLGLLFSPDDDAGSVDIMKNTPDGHLDKIRLVVVSEKFHAIVQ